MPRVYHISVTNFFNAQVKVATVQLVSFDVVVLGIERVVLDGGATEAIPLCSNIMFLVAVEQDPEHKKTQP